MRLWFLQRRNRIDELYRQGLLPISGGQDDPEPDPPPRRKESGVTFTREQQAHIDQLIADAMGRARQQAEQEAERKRQELEAREQGRLQEIIDSRDARIAELEARLEELEAQIAEGDKTSSRMAAVVDQLAAGLLASLDPLTRKAIERLEPLEQLEFVAENMEELAVPIPAERVSPTGGNRSRERERGAKESAASTFIRSKYGKQE